MKDYEGEFERTETAAVSGAVPCSAKFFAAKIAFEIPEKYEVEGHITRAIPDELVNALMDLFDDCEFEPAGICSLPLLIVNTGEASPAWIARAEKRINAVLQNAGAQRPAGKDHE